MMILYKLLLSSLVALQVIGPSWVLAIQTPETFVQGASKSQALIVGIRGVVTVTPGKNGPGYTPKYRAALAIGDVISTEAESVAEILLENQGLVTIHEYSEAMLDKKADGGLSIALEAGAAEWSIPIQRQGGIPLTFTTPNIRATTHGGLVTAEVQPTLGEMARAPRLRDSFLIRASLQAQSARDVGLLETFCVNEGDLTVEYPGPQQGLWQQETVAPGECRGFLNGQPRAMATAMGTEYGLVDWRAVCAVGTHCEIPESAKQLIAKQQMAQAVVLEQALLGVASEDCRLGGPNKNKQECIIDEQLIIATTGLTNGQLLEGGGPGNGGNSGVILPCTGDPQSCIDGGGNGGGGGPTPTPIIPGSPDPPVGGMPPPSSQFFTQFFDIGSSAPGSPGSTAPLLGLPSNIQPGEQLWPVNGMPGGEGLLTFLKGDFTADKELFLADSGLLDEAPHKGIAPQNSFVVSDLSPDGAGSPSNQKLPIRFGAYAITLPDFNPPPNKVQLGVEGTSREAQSQQLAQFARSPMVNPNDPLGSVPPGSGDFSAESNFQVFLGAGEEGLENRDTEYPGGPLAGIDGTIQVRSASTVDPRTFGNRVVTLKKGVVLGATQVSLALQEKTNDSFSGLETTLGQAIQGAAVSILGVPGDPAIVQVEDRVLAILGGSRIQPADPSVTTALLAVLDGRLRGPIEPPVIGQDDAGEDIFREDVSPIIEMTGGSADVTTGVMVGSTANTGQTGDLDQALLEASSPLLAMMQSSMTTSSDFGRVAGQNAKLVATLIPGDALVRLNASSLMINGNLFNVTGGGQLIVNGSLVSVQGGSSLTLNGGVFANVGAGSMFSLTNGALVDFGTGNNVVNVSNDLCAGGGCFSPFANPAYQVAGSPADFSVAPGFEPVLDVGTFQDGSVNELNLGPNSAILAVEPGGSIQLQ
jgi:hypothetical protein